MSGNSVDKFGGGERRTTGHWIARIFADGALYGALPRNTVAHEAINRGALAVPMGKVAPSALADLPIDGSHADGVCGDVVDD
jgi:hypothetical protein